MKRQQVRGLDDRLADAEEAREQLALVRESTAVPRPFSQTWNASGYGSSGSA